MRKITILLIGALIIASAVLIAGCITPHDENQTNNTKIKAPVLTVSVEKQTSNIYANDKIQFILPSNPTTGYNWEITSSDGLTVEEHYAQRENSENLDGAGGAQTYIISAEKAGTYTFTAVYKRSWEDNAPLYTFTQTIVVNDIDGHTASPDPIMIVRFDGNVNPSVGDNVEIITAGNPTTGYEWKVSSKSDVRLVKENYIVDEHEEGMVGVGGTYKWYVTAEKAGTYTFGAEYKRSWEEGTANSFFFNLTFI
ncbi:MAG: protease inhibitor I42 family protein [Methanocorpusculum sp.]|nr:protease inhibitor I42 family protein [Methanocorpusculum sp.]